MFILKYAEFLNVWFCLCQIRNIEVFYAMHFLYIFQKQPELLGPKFSPKFSSWSKILSKIFENLEQNFKIFKQQNKIFKFFIIISEQF